MDMLIDIATIILAQFQKPTLSFLLGGMVLAALGSKLEVPQPVYKFIVLLLLLKVGLGAGISVRQANFFALAVPAHCAILAGVTIVLIGSRMLARCVPHRRHCNGWSFRGCFRLDAGGGNGDPR